jgi:DNA-binding IclR family transcriptional regulator
MSGNNSEPGRTVLSKAFAVLSALRSAETGLTRAQIARRTGLPMTTVHRLATELRAHGALELGENGTYRVGGWLWELGTLTPDRASLREIALPFMEDLYEATHENVQLAVLDGFDALLVERIRGARSVPILSRVGGRLPLHATGVGKVLLAYAPPAFLETFLARGLPQRTANTITDADELRRGLADVRRNGYAVTRDEMTVGAVSVGAAIFGPDDLPVGAVSLVVSSRGAAVDRLAPAVRAVARGMSRRVSEVWDRAGR